MALGREAAGGRTPRAPMPLRAGLAIIVQLHCAMIKESLALVAMSALVAGCASGPQSHDLPLEAASKLQHAHVVLSAPGASSIPREARTDPGSDAIVGLPAPGLTPAQSVSPAGIVGGAIAMALIGALVGADAEAQRQESIKLLSRDGRIPNQEFALSVAAREFSALASKDTPMRVVDVVNAEAISAGAARRIEMQRSAAVMQVTVRQTMSVDLSRLRIHVRAKLVSSDGAELMDQSIFYLPISIPGITNKDALGNWAEQDFRLYREHVSMGVAGAVDALNVVAFSRIQHDPESLPDAQSLLKRRNCFGGDYDAGIPMSAFQAGRILPTRPAVTAIKLQNGDILVFPRCEA